MNTNNSQHKTEQKSIFGGFFGFWIQKYRISYLLTIVLIVTGLGAIFQIPKESSPNVELGIIQISTAYPGANPQDVDSLITKKLIQSIENIKGIDSINGTSSIGISNIVVMIKNNQNINDISNSIRNKINSVSLPSDAKTPNMNNIETSTSKMFSLYLFHKNNTASQADLVFQGNELKSALEKLDAIKTVEIANAQYQTEIIVSQEKLESLGISLSQIADTINSFNRDQPIGNFSIENKNYDYRIQGKFDDIETFLQTPISLPKGGNITLKDISKTKTAFKNNAENQILVNEKMYNAIEITVHKSDNYSIFGANDLAKEKLSQIFEQDNFRDYSFQYTYNIAEEISKDYKDLLNEGGSTLILVFISILIFVGFFDAIFATLTLPLAFLATFIILNSTGYSMNFLTNFSLILSFGIAIDTIIVIVQAANTKLKLGYSPTNAISLALKEYALPTIVGVSTTIVVFLPMMILPGMMGKFLAYIPITIFGVLASGLILALTINSALYLLFTKNKPKYISSPEYENYLSSEEKMILEQDRQGKETILTTNKPIREKITQTIINKYKNILRIILASKKYRKISIFLPVVLLFASFFFLAPQIKFELFPSDDNSQISYTIESSIGTNTSSMQQQIGNIAPIFANIPEIKTLTTSIFQNTAQIDIELIDKEIRQKNNQKSVFELEKIINKRLEVFAKNGLKVTSGIASMGPPKSGGSIGINLITDDASKVPQLLSVSRDFENFIQQLPHTKNINSSSKSTPGQFVFEIKKELATQKGISPAQIYAKILQETNGITVGSLEKQGKDIDIILKNSQFENDIHPDNIKNITITQGKNTYSIGDFITTKTQNSIEQITRKDGKISITVSADLDEMGDSITTTAKIQEYAKNYNFPSGINFSNSGENAENSDLIIAMITALFLSITIIFGILTLQFDSFRKSLIVFFSVFTAIPSVLFGLIITNNPYSMMFGIGFISFMGVAVNHGIILIDSIHLNLKKGMNTLDALIDAGGSRLEPMLLTTITTVLGMLPIALKDKMWAGMGWTIVFGLIATTIITLFALAPLFYEIFYTEKKPNIIKRIWNKIRKKPTENTPKNTQ